MRKIANQAKEIAALLKVLANENRLQIFCALMARPMHVHEIAKFVPGITQSALSQHLALLKAYRILDAQKSGQSITYSIIDRRAEAVVRALQKYYCAADTPPGEI